MGLITSKQKIEPVSGEKKAVLIGFKHPGINNDHIKGSIIRMKKNLMDLRGFSENNIVLMIQDEPSYSQPDEYNMEDTLASLFEDANPFDTLFIHLIAPYASQGTNDDIPAEHFFRELLKNVRNGCTLTFVFDCLLTDPAEKPVMPSSSVMISDQVREGSDSDQVREFVTYLVNNPQEEDVNQTQHHQVVTQSLNTDLLPDSRATLLMAVQQHDQNVAPPSTTTVYGGFSNAVLDVIEETNGRVTNLELARKAMEKLRMQGIHQKLVLGCSDHLHGYDDSFLS